MSILVVSSHSFQGFQLQLTIRKIITTNLGLLFSPEHFLS